MPRKNESPTRPVTFTDVIGDLLKRGLKVLPIECGQKATRQSGWPDFNPTTVADVLARGAKVWRQTVPEGLTLAEAQDRMLNLGVLNEPSRTISLDLDHPLAHEALQAGFAALGVKEPKTFPRIGWDSVKGSKMLFRAPADLGGKYAKLVIRQRDEGQVKSTTVLELRGVGYDLIPPSVRKDASKVLEWSAMPPEGVPTLPDHLAKLMRAMIENKTDVLDAMKIAAGCDTDYLRNDGTSLEDYPPALKGRAAERAIVNGAFSVEELLADFGYVRSGSSRWRDANSTHADGVTPMKGARGAAGEWVCYHASSPIAGAFDAWRLFVEYSHGGDLEAACAEAREFSRGAVRAATGEKKPDAPKGVRPKNTTLNDATIAEPKKKSNPPAKKNVKEPEITDDTSESSDGFDDTPVGTYYKNFKVGPDRHITEKVCNLPMEAPGLYLLAGRPKSGKSWLSAGIGVACAKGGTFAGVTFPKAHKVLYLSLDDTDKERFGVRLEHFDNYRAMPEAEKNRFVLITTIPAEDPHGELERKIVADPSIRLVIIDTWAAWKTQTSLAPDTKRATNAYDEDVIAFKPLQGITRRTGVTILLVHHVNKQIKSFVDIGDALNSISGTMGTQGATDGNFVLFRDEANESRRRLARLGGRTRANHEPDALLEMIDGQWIDLGIKGAFMSLMDLRDGLLNYMTTRTSTEPASLSELVNAMKTQGHSEHAKTVGRAARALVSENLLESARGHGGGYVITEAGKTALQKERGRSAMNGGKPQRF